MAIAYVENGVAVSYHGVTVYHVYKDDLIAMPPRDALFTLDPFGSEMSEETFDIRELQGYDHQLSAAANLVQMIDSGLFGDTDLPEREGTGEDTYYPVEEARDGECPVCNAKIEDYGCLEVIDDQIKYPFTCKNCGVSGAEWGRIEFDGFTIP